MAVNSPARTRLRRTISGAGAVLLVAAGLAAGASPAVAASHSDTRLSAGRYLVTFADEPAASYEGNVKGFPRTRPDAGKKLDPTRTEVVRWRQHLTAVHDSTLQKVGASKLADYTVATNGVAAELTAAQATALAKTAGVTGLQKDALKQADTTYSPEYLGLSAAGGLWSQLGGQTQAGKGVIVGVIDTGIWPESPAFAGGELKRDRAGQPVASSGLRGRWFGACVQGELFDSQDCNDKLIGARYYVAGFGKQNIAKGEYLSPRDGAGHGSHTASTAAGNRVSGVTVDGTAMGTASGMAPGADVAAYKVCWEAKPGASGGCFNSDSVAAIDDAVADGVDVLNYSIGGSSESAPYDVVEMAFRRAANLGIFVAASAGNSGPGASTLDHPSPWLTTVAASTFRLAENVVELGDGQRFIGASTTATMPTQTTLVRSTSVAVTGADPDEARLCYPGSLDPAKAGGKVVQCDRGVISRIDKSFEVKRAGGVAMVLTNASASSLNGDLHAVPSVHVSHVARAAILTYIATAGTAATAAITAVNPGESSTQVPEVTTFSSRGPSTTTGGDLLKPDLAAPGNDVLAAVAPPSNHGRSWDYYSGTSMAAPHIAGIGALVKASHPTWSASRVKSALMTSARDHATNADPFAQGAGFVQPNKAVDPGLVFDATPNDWRSYLVSLGVHFSAPFDTLPALDGSDLNQASVAIGALAGRQVVTRTVTNVSGSSETYDVASSVPGLNVVADPSSFTLAAGASRSVQLTITRDTAPLGQWAKGNVTFTSPDHVVRVPLVAKPVAIAAPTEISGTGQSGSTSFDVTPGFTGVLTTTVDGLVGATPTSDTVVNGPFTPAPSAATKAYELVVPVGTKVARFDVDAASGLDDLDLYVYKGGALVAMSASAAGDEQVTLHDPAAGTYTAYVNGYDTASGGGAYSYTPWAVPAGDSGNLVVTGGGPVTLGTPVTLTATWSGLAAGQRYLGIIGYGGATERTLVSIG